MLHKCTLLISGSRWVWTEAKPCCLFVMFCLCFFLSFCCSDVFLIIPWLCRSHEWRKGLESQSSTGRVAPVPTLRFKASPSHSLQPRFVFNSMREIVFILRGIPLWLPFRQRLSSPKLGLGWKTWTTWMCHYWIIRDKIGTSKKINKVSAAFVRIDFCLML